MEPFSNELTRMGGYLENDYGWNNPQEHFQKPLFKKASSIEDYTQHYDVIIVGNSFSDDESHGWQNYLANETGLTILLFNVFSVSVDNIINSDMYQINPPKLFIYESVERNIISQHNQCEYDKLPINSDFTPPPFNIDPLSIPVGKIARKRNVSSIKDIDLSSSINYLSKSISRNLFNVNITEVHPFKLTKHGLFSSKTNDSLLVITRDFQLKDVNFPEIETTKCSLLLLQNKIRANNKTEFITLIFPDKTTVYSDFIDDKSYSNMSILSKLEDTPGLNIVPIIDDFKQSVSDGVIDFYLPNDTHCGFFAYKQAAEALLELLNDL